MSFFSCEQVLAANAIHSIVLGAWCSVVTVCRHACTMDLNFILLFIYFTNSLWVLHYSDMYVQLYRTQAIVLWVVWFAWNCVCRCRDNNLLLYAQAQLLFVHLQMEKDKKDTQFNSIVFIRLTVLFLCTARIQRHKIFPLNYGALVWSSHFCGFLSPPRTATLWLPLVTNSILLWTKNES